MESERWEVGPKIGVGWRWDWQEVGCGIGWRREVGQINMLELGG